MARALLVGCGCRGRELGVRLLDAGWQVRGTTRRAGATPEIERAGIEPAVADPDRIATVLDHIEGVTVVTWLLGSASGPQEEVAALHGPRLERLCEELVDTHVRGLVYEAEGAVAPRSLSRGRSVVEAASGRWRMPVALIEHSPADAGGWAGAATAAVLSLTGQHPGAKPGY